MLQAVSATESNRLTWFSGMRTLVDLPKLTTAITTLHTASARSNTGEPTAGTAQWERSNSWLFLIFAGVLFRIFQAARRTVELRQKLEYAAPLGSRRNMNVSSVWNVKITEQSNETLLSELLRRSNQDLSRSVAP